jgi:hypothetical protein
LIGKANVCFILEKNRYVFLHIANIGAMECTPLGQELEKAASWHKGRDFHQAVLVI